MTDLGHWASQCCQVEVPVRPVDGLPDISVIAAIHAGIMSRILLMRKLFTAQNADNNAAICRTESRTCVALGAGAQKIPHIPTLRGWYFFAPTR